MSAGDSATGDERPVLVAGGAGYIGSHTVRALEEQGAPVVVLDDLSAGHREALRAPLEVCDLGDELGRGRFDEHAGEEGTIDPGPKITRMGLPGR